MQIRDIQLADICAGKNWRLVPQTECWFDAPMEEWGPIIETDQFQPDDHIVYSGLIVYSTGRVVPIVMVRTVSDGSYFGDSCEFIDGAWRQAGLEPNPNADGSREFIANPLRIDESFSDDEYRTEHREGFLFHVSRLQRAS